MENLNKENFFNEMDKKYPMTMARFKVWIDEYKHQVKWDELFNAGALSDYCIEKLDEDEIKAPKFHDLPIDMQTGILAAFLAKEIGVPRKTIEGSKIFFDEKFSQVEQKLFFSGK